MKIQDGAIRFAIIERRLMEYIHSTVESKSFSWNERDLPEGSARSESEPHEKNFPERIQLFSMDLDTPC